MNLGYFTGSFGQLPVETALKTTAMVGFDGVELCTWPDYPTDVDRLDDQMCLFIRALTDHLGLTISALGAHVGTIAIDPAQRTERMDRMRRNLDAAAALGVPVVDTLSGSAPEGCSETDAWRLLEETTAELTRYAAQVGVIIGFEPHIGMLIDSPDRVIRLVHAINSPALRVNLDCSHFDVLGLDVIGAVHQLGPLSVHAHLKDSTGRYPDHQFLIPGEGTFDLKGFLTALRETGYDGYVTPEIAVMRRAKPDYDPFHAAELTYRTVSRAFEELGIQRVRYNT